MVQPGEQKTVQEADNRRSQGKGIGYIAAGGLWTASAVLLFFMFEFTDDHRWFWVAAPIVSLAGILFAFVGTLLIGRWSARPEHGSLRILALGGISGIACIGSGFLAVLLAFPAGNYLSGFEIPVRWSTYSGDYVVGSYVIRLLQFSILTAIVSGGALGIGAGEQGPDSYDPGRTAAKD